MATPAIAQPIPMPAMPPLETLGLGVVVEVALGPGLPVKLLDMVGEGKDKMDEVLEWKLWLESVVDGVDVEGFGVVVVVIGPSV